MKRVYCCNVMEDNNEKYAKKKKLHFQADPEVLYATCDRYRIPAQLNFEILMLILCSLH